MTEEDEGLVERVAMLPDGNAWPSTVELLCDLRDRIEAQAAEIEKLRAALEARGLEIREKQMSNDVKEVGSVWKLKDMQFTPYEEGEELIYEGTYGLFTTREAAERFGRLLTERRSNLPRGNWVITEETLYE